MKYFSALTLFCLIALAVAEDANALENRYVNRTQAAYSGRLIAPNRYNLRRRPTMANIAPHANAQKTANAQKIIKKMPHLRSPKTELVIKPFEYYNDAPIKVASPTIEPAIAPAKYVMLPWIETGDTKKKIELVNNNIEIAKPVAKIVKVPMVKPTPKQEVALNNVALNEVDFSTQPLQIKQPIIKEVIVKEVIAEQPAPAKPAPAKPKLIQPEAMLPAPFQPSPAEIAPEKTISEVPNIASNEPQPTEISAQTKNILQKLPYDIFPEPRMEKGNFDVSRTKKQGEIDATAAQDIGASVAVRRQSFDVNYELDKAYNALIRGNTEQAVQIYREVLAAEPNNKYALFGLATTYHKLGMAEQARPIYGRLLELDPYNKEALNNFLALVGEEAPEQAILYLEQLKSQNSDFSPIYAQLAGLYLKQGNNPLAIENMQEAVGIAPENLVYKYNLAVMYDKAKQPERAATLYRQLVKAGLDGAELPTNLANIQKRLTFLSSNGN